MLKKIARIFTLYSRRRIVTIINAHLESVHREKLCIYRFQLVG